MLVVENWLSQFRLLCTVVPCECECVRADVSSMEGPPSLLLCVLHLNQRRVKLPLCRGCAAVTIPATKFDGVRAEDVRPLVVLAAVHMKHITDLAWSPDGRYLVATSHDGYCTIVQFEPGELGEPLKNHRHDAMSVRTAMAQRRPPAVCPPPYSSICVVYRGGTDLWSTGYTAVWSAARFDFKSHVQRTPKPKKTKDAAAAKPKALQQTKLAAPATSPIKTLLDSASKVRKIQAVAIPDIAAPQPEPASVGVVHHPIAPQTPASAAVAAVPSGTPATISADAQSPTGAVPATEAPPQLKTRTPDASGARDTCDTSMSLGGSDSDASDAPDPASDMEDDGGPTSTPDAAASSIAFLAAQAGQQAAGQRDS